MRVSLFLDPDLTQVQLAKDIEADRIELYTEPYAKTFLGENLETVLQQYAQAAQKAHEIGLGVNAGHDLNRHMMRVMEERYNLPLGENQTLNNFFSLEQIYWQTCYHKSAFLNLHSCNHFVYNLDMSVASQKKVTQANKCHGISL